MSVFKDKVKEYLGQEIFIKDVNGTAYAGILKEVGEDFCVLLIAKRVLAYNIHHIVSIEPRLQAGTETPASPKTE